MSVSGRHQAEVLCNRGRGGAFDRLCIMPESRNMGMWLIVAMCGGVLFHCLRLSSSLVCDQSDFSRGADARRATA